MFEDMGGYRDSYEDDPFSDAWKHKDPSMWTMRDCAAYELAMMCEQHDETLQKEQDNA